MKNFLELQKVGCYEKGLLMSECEKQLGWSYHHWHRREVGDTKLAPAERIALEKILQDIRTSQVVETLDDDMKAALEHTASM